ncbi:hypothetical protein [Trichoplusia ni ascovirus 2c]|uniref:hypothetical protein n=1 Tax=Trichoplusia ni ascovirus 2c TaxID=328615 RepID=UPI0000E44249|nr:hypothetical protein TNAV2c_gp113 [Trichoplusia ni ascovirus 2c]ABF70630.1 hypothetical protein [Trichoplusia ni ascovirus 2c]
METMNKTDSSTVVTSSSSMCPPKLLLSTEEIHGRLIVKDFSPDGLLQLETCVSNSHNHGNACPRGLIVMRTTNNNNKEEDWKKKKQLTSKKTTTIVRSSPNPIIKCVDNIAESNLHLLQTICDFNGQKSSSSSPQVYSLKVLFEYAEIRIYNFNDKWYISTSTKLDANRSLWGTDHTTQRIGEVFKIALRSHRNTSVEDMISKKELNPKYVYRFALTTPKQCRRGWLSKSMEKFTYYQSNSRGRYNDDDNYYTDDCDEIIKIHFKDWTLPECNGLVDVMLMKYPFTNGYGAFLHNPQSNTTIHYVNKDYMRLNSIVGTAQSPYNAYVQNLCNKNNLLVLRNLYPECCNRFDAYDECIMNLSVNLYNCKYYGLPCPNFLKDLLHHVLRDLQTFEQYYKKSGYDDDDDNDDDISNIRLTTIEKIIKCSYNKSKLNNIIKSRYKTMISMDLG